MENNDPILSQTKLIEAHLKSGKTINPIEALTEYGCFRLGARIWDLRDSGMEIVSEIVKKGRKRFAQYKIE